MLRWALCSHLLSFLQFRHERVQGVLVGAEVCERDVVAVWADVLSAPGLGHERLHAAGLHAVHWELRGDLRVEELHELLNTLRLM